MCSGNQITCTGCQLQLAKAGRKTRQQRLDTCYITAEARFCVHMRTYVRLVRRRESIAAYLLP